MRIPDTCKCLWCDGTMERRGVTQLGFGINTFSLWCTKCGAVNVHVTHTSKKIESLETKIKFKEE